MQLDLYVNTLGRHLKQRFPHRVRKLSVDGAFTCPNRDGTIGRGGCTFCNVDSFVKPHQQSLGVAEQLEQRKAEMKHKDIGYLAYFQAYTSTYAEIEYLQGMYQQALEDPSVVGLCIGTRPDCVPEQVLNLLADYQQQGKEVWLELGLQTAHDDTLKRINRGHGFAEFADTVAKAKSLNLQVCAHLILGLPGEGPEHYMQTLQQVLALDVDGIKLHPLHVVEGSIMAKAYRAGRIELMSQDEYVEQAIRLIQHTPPEVVYHRVAAEARKPLLVAPDWCEQRWPPITAIAKGLAATGVQGSRYCSE
ncbi:TIGR01212 family radical SAM protein [Aliagarivorans marinus]|uniref:TIGR01212 family radical SAM protein n=1 Tax=Aliagarivorans marinus TaxID=561965 RepID=UPI0003FD4D22|nr:TIGR01212 family radical SAM protein [Aliagarivorans marinus]